MNSAIWQELKGEHTYKFQVHGKELIKKVKRRKDWTQIAYGWDDEGKDIVIFTKYFRHPSDAKKEAQNIDPNAEFKD